MSFNFVKHIPWILPVVAIGAVGSGALNGFTNAGTTGAPTTAAADAAVVADPQVENATVAALAAVTAATTPPAPVVPATTSQQIAALLDEPVVTPQADVVIEDVEVTRSRGLSVTAVQPVTEPAALTPDQPVAVEPVSEQGSVDVNFFTAAQASIAQANSCMNDLRNLATQARVYFPSGALTGEDGGIAQARLLGTIAQQCPGARIQVLGHSDSSGDPAVNLRLSQSRAETVITRIAAAGIDTSNMVAIGMGDRIPSNVRGPEAAAYYDRRVEFSVLEAAATATTPTFGAASNLQLAACVGELEDAVRATTISYAPGSVTMSRDDLNLASTLAQMAADCPQARLRVIGQFEEAFGAVESPATARLRAVAVMTSLVGEGYDASQLIMAAPSGSTPIPGLSNSRVDFDVILEEL